MSMQAFTDSITRAARGQPISASDWNKIVEGLRIALNVTGPDVMVNRTGIHIRARAAAQRDVMFFPAVITDVAAILGEPPFRWKYAWDLITPTPSDFYEVPIDGLGGSLTGDYALNMVEMGHTQTNAAPGIDMSPASEYPAGWSLRPIKVGTPVPMHLLRRSDGELKPYFWMVNAHDGTCT